MMRIFHAASESTVLLEIMHLNWLVNESERAILIYLAGQALKNCLIKMREHTLSGFLECTAIDSTAPGVTLKSSGTLK